MFIHRCTFVGWTIQRVRRPSNYQPDRQISSIPPGFRFLSPTLSSLQLVFMLRPWLSSGAVRALSRAPRSLRPILIPRNNFSSASNLQIDRVPLRKQLKQDAKSLKAQKKQRKENEEASRQEWELTVGVEIHAQLDTAAKLFSSMSTKSLCLRR